MRSSRCIANPEDELTGADDWARLRHTRYAAALYESQSMRAANRKALKPQSTRQAKLVAWHLTYRVPLHFAAIPGADIREACER